MLIVKRSKIVVAEVVGKKKKTFDNGMPETN